MVPDNKPHSNSMNSINKKSDRQTETLYSKKPKSIPLIVKSSTMTDEQQSITTGDSDDEFERTKTLPNNILVRKFLLNFLNPKKNNFVL